MNLTKFCIALIMTASVSAGDNGAYPEFTRKVVLDVCMNRFTPLERRMMRETKTRIEAGGMALMIYIEHQNARAKRLEALMNICNDDEAIAYHKRVTGKNPKTELQALYREAKFYQNEIDSLSDVLSRLSDKK